MIEDEDDEDGEDEGGNVRGFGDDRDDGAFTVGDACDDKDDDKDGDTFVGMSFPARWVGILMMASLS